MKSVGTPQIHVERALRAELAFVLRQGVALTDFGEATVQSAIAFRRVHTSSDALAEAASEEQHQTDVFGTCLGRLGETPSQACCQSKEARPMHCVVELFISSGADLERLFDFLLDQAEATNDLELAQAAISAVGATVRHELAITPFSFRKAARHHPAQRK